MIPIRNMMAKPTAIAKLSTFTLSVRRNTTFAEINKFRLLNLPTSSLYIQNTIGHTYNREEIENVKRLFSSEVN